MSVQNPSIYPYILKIFASINSKIRNNLKNILIFDNTTERS